MWEFVSYLRASPLDGPFAVAAGSGKMIVLALSGILGLMVGVMAAFFLEFVRSARQRVVEIR